MTAKLLIGVAICCASTGAIAAPAATCDAKPFTLRKPAPKPTAEPPKPKPAAAPQAQAPASKKKPGAPGCDKAGAGKG